MHRSAKTSRSALGYHKAEAASSMCRDDRLRNESHRCPSQRSDLHHFRRWWTDGLNRVAGGRTLRACWDAGLSARRYAPPPGGGSWG